jgi:threonine synthase
MSTLQLHLRIDNRADLFRMKMSMNAAGPKLKQGGGVIERYRKFLPVSNSTPIVSLGEGDTPLIYSAKLSARLGRSCEVFI